MIGEIIAIGNELTSGRVLNTTSRFAAGLLFSAGHEISAMSTIGDTPAEISETLKRAIKSSDFVIVTGGLGATSDDLTSEVVGQALGRPTVFHPEVFAKIKALLANPDDQALSDLQKLALLPQGLRYSTLKPGWQDIFWCMTTNRFFSFPVFPMKCRNYSPIRSFQDLVYGRRVLLNWLNKKCIRFLDCLK